MPKWVIFKSFSIIDEPVGGTYTENNGVLSGLVFDLAVHFNVNY
jgi:hypothetical protein